MGNKPKLRASSKFSSAQRKENLARKPLPARISSDGLVDSEAWRAKAASPPSAETQSTWMEI